MRKIKIKLAEHLKSRDITQSQFAEQAGVRPTVVSNYCRGFVDRFYMEHLIKICDTLGLDSLSDLIELEDE